MRAIWPSFWPHPFHWPVRGLAAERPVDHQRAAFQVVARHGAPIARVVGVVAVVAEEEVVLLRHDERAEVVPPACFAIEVAAIGKSAVDVPARGVAGVFDDGAVDPELLVYDLDLVAGEPDTALDEIRGRALWRAEDHDVAAAHVPRGRQLTFSRRGGEPEQVSIDEEMVADQEGVLHRTARDVEGLDQEGVGETQKDAGDQQGLEVFPEPVLSFFHRGVI